MGRDRYRRVPALAAILQVANTIRLAAYAAGREIGIMRLVGARASTSQLPFLMETLVATLIGLLLAFGVVAVFMHFVVYGLLRTSTCWRG